MPEFFMPPHADVRVIVRDLSAMKSGLEAIGLQAPALDAAIEMLTKQSIEIDQIRNGGAA